MGVCNQITTLLKVIDASIQVSDIFGLTVILKFINFSFQVFFFFVPEMSISLMPYVV